MDLWLQHWFDSLPTSFVTMMAGDGLARATMFLMVASRLGGFFLYCPWLGQGSFPWSARIGLVIVLTLIVAPGIAVPSQEMSDVIAISHQDVEGFVGDRVSTAASGVWSPSDLVAALLIQALIGAFLSLSIAIFVSGLKLAGEWVDRHSGLGMGQVVNPEYSQDQTGAAKLVSLLCTAVLLTMPPINGHLQAVRLILDTFRVIPISSAMSAESISSVLIAMLQQSLVLGLRIAMPFVVAMSLLDLTLGWVRRSSRWEMASVAVALRAGASLLILAATLPGIQEAVMSSVHDSFEVLETSLNHRQ